MDGYGWLWIFMVDSDDFFEMLTTLYHIHPYSCCDFMVFYRFLPKLYSHIDPYNSLQFHIIHSDPIY